MTMIQRAYPLFGLAAALLTTTAHAWDPNAGAELPAPATFKRLPESVVPSRYHVEAARPVIITPPAPAPAIIAPLPEPQPAPIAYQPAPAPAVIEAPIRYIPVEQPAAIEPAPAIAYTPAPLPPIAYTPAPVALEPVSYLPPINPDAHKISTTTRNNHFSLGVEAFYDRYEEPDTFPDLGVNAYYGAIDGSWTHDFNSAWFGRAEGRASYGRADYSSNSGKVNGISDYEFDARYVAGYDFARGTTHFKPYIGLGSRLYLDYFKDPDFPGTYDRRILQIYAPIGATYSWVGSSGMTYTPLLEIDPLLYGYVQSRLQSIPGLVQADNTQTSGIGWRAEFMMGRIDQDGRGWQFGPFARYWDIDDSDYDSAANAYEPKNTRWQVGAKLNYLF